MAPAPEVPDRPPPYAAIAFDCDSTLSEIEGIEELARLAGGPEEELRRLTDAAMAGEVPLEEVYGRRLALVRPSRADVARAGRRYVETLVPGARETVAELRARGKRVAIVSGGVRQAVLVLARELGVLDEDVAAVDVRFSEDGAYAGFDEESPLARSGGKAVVLRRLGDRYGSVALVGDGATDLEAATAVARFVAFGGVARRESVFAAARAACDERDLRAVLPFLLAAEESA